MRTFSAPISALAAMSVIVTREPEIPPMPAISSAPSHGQGQRSRPSHTTRHTPHGKRERERRLRQIARGQLRAENGLVRSA